MLSFTPGHNYVVLLSGKLISDDDKPLYARDGWQIPTENPPKFALAMLRNKAEHWKRYRPSATLRSISHPDYPYNCVGMIFAARRHWIEIDYMADLLQHDGYRQVSKSDVVAGDIVLYRDHKNEYSHVALVVPANLIRDTMNIRVLSKWGLDPEYEHFEDDVPENIGKVSEYWSERVT